MLERILGKENMTRAYKRVKSNKGASGIDGMGVESLRPYLDDAWVFTKAEILEGKYIPQAVLEVEIPKPNGGIRKLGIPTVVDRLIQQAIAQELNEIFDETFSEYSYGFRPGRSAHQAVRQAEQYINEGKEYVVEIDLENFFDKVNHDKLMYLISKRVTDKRVQKIIRRYLTNGIMKGGVVSKRIEGTPQGSPLSPILSNILLDELDKELTKRGHKFVRYADDCSIYLRSRRSAERVLESITVYIEKYLKLRVNRKKSKVSTPSESNLLGFTFNQKEETYRIKVGAKAQERIKEKIHLLTRRSWGVKIECRLEKLKEVTRGWVEYFRIAECKYALIRLDKWIRTRLRMCIWKSWKTAKNRIKQLIKLGMSKSEAYQKANTQKSYCRTAHSPTLLCILTNDYLRKLGYSEMSK